MTNAFHSSVGHSDSKAFHHSLSFRDGEEAMEAVNSEDTKQVKKSRHNNSFNFDTDFSSMTYSQLTDSYGESSLNNSVSDATPNFSQSSMAQYEPISSPEGDDEDFYAHKLDYSYTVGNHKFPFSQTSSVPSVSHSHASKDDGSEVIEIADDMDTSTDSSDDSEDDDDDDNDDDNSKISTRPNFNSQMQSAIDSILSIDDDSPQPSASYSDHSQHFIQPDYDSSQSENSAMNSPQPEGNEMSVDDDLDAAVQSILM